MPWGSAQLESSLDSWGGETDPSLWGRHLKDWVAAFHLPHSPTLPCPPLPHLCPSETGFPVPQTGQGHSSLRTLPVPVPQMLLPSWLFRVI